MSKESFEPLAYRRREAAQLLGVSVRQLARMTTPRGPLPCVRIGACIRYRRTDLDDFLAKHVEPEASE